MLVVKAVVVPGPIVDVVLEADVAAVEDDTAVAKKVYEAYLYLLLVRLLLLLFFFFLSSYSPKCSSLSWNILVR